jgi:hypothetical protein
MEWRSPSASQQDYSGAGFGDPDNYCVMWRTMVEMIDIVTKNLDTYVPGYMIATTMKLRALFGCKASAGMMHSMTHAP